MLQVKNVILILSCALCFGTLFSCNNVSNDAGGTLQDSGAKTIIFNGSASSNSALPSDIARAVSSLPGEGLSRSAIPSLDSSEYYRFVQAVQTDGSGSYKLGRGDQDQFSGSGGSFAFSLPLTKGHWEITAGVKKNMGGAEENDKTVLSDYCEKTLDDGEPVISHTFAIVPFQTGDLDERGSVELDVSSDPSLGANQLLLLCSDQKFKAAWGDPLMHVVELTGGGAHVSILAIQGGTYEVNFCFLKEGRHVYSTVQTVCVFDNMKTDTWLSDGSGLINDSGLFYVTQDLVQKDMDSVIYVGVPAALSGVEGVAAEPSNSGHAYEPLATLQNAVDKIASFGNGAVDYKIYVSGTLAPPSKLELSAALNSKARSLEICGLDPLDDGTPVSAINAGGIGTALTVSTTAPVIIKNIKITGGNATNGGGIYVAGGATVTLGEGACVAGNKASYGGGVYVAGDLLIDGGVVGDKNATDHAKYEGDSYSNYAGEKGGGVCFAATGKVTLKSGIVAYNYSKRGGGIATSFDNSSDNSQLDLKGGEVRFNCAGPYDNYVVGGGLFLKGCKFYFTGGKVHHNYAGDGGGGISLQKTVGAAIMSGGSVYDNEYRNTTPGTKVDHKWGSDLLLFDEATLDITGGRIYSSSQKDYGVMIRTSSCALNISGRAEISKETPLLPGDIIYHEDSHSYEYVDNPITIAGALTPPDGDASKKNAYIVPTHWKRGLTVINAPAGIPAASAKALIANNIGRFATTDVDFDVRANETVGIINAPFCVAASGSTRTATDSDGKSWGEPSDDPAVARGTRSYPYAKMSQVMDQITALADNTVPYEILINGTVKGYDYAHAEFDGSKAGSVTIRGANGNNAVDILDADKLEASAGAGGGAPDYTVLKFVGIDADHKMSVTVQDLKICGGNNTVSDSSGGFGGGINAQSADISLAKGALVAGNKARIGGGIYIAAGNLFVYADACIGEKGSGMATGSGVASGQCSNNASSNGGGIACAAGGVYLGYKENMAVATGADAWTGGVYRNSAACGGGIYLANMAECRMAAGTVSQNLGDSGGAFYNNPLNDKDFVMGGSAWIPYGAGKGKNDVFLNEGYSITIASALSLPAGESGANATITPGGWKRGTVIAKGKDGGQIPSEATTSGAIQKRLALAGKADDGWKTYLSNDNKQLKIMAPICVAPADYAETPGSNSNIGTYTKPYATVTKALTDLNDPEVDYEIYIKGTIIDRVTISQTKAANAKSLLLKGYNYANLGSSANDTLSGGCVADTAWESAGRTLWVKGDVPVTIEALKITGGKENANGGGIFVDNGANLILSYFTRIMGNYTALEGAGVYVDAGGTLNVNYNVTVKDNKTVVYSDNSLLGDSNVYLPSGKVIHVIGSLADREGDAEIWVSTQDKPTISGSGASATVTTVPITSHYAVFNSEGGTTVAPSKYFKGDKYGVALVGNEAALGANGGALVIKPLYENITISVDKTRFLKDAPTKQMAFSAKATAADGTEAAVPIGSGEGKMALAFEMTYHGETVTSSYYEQGTGTDMNKLTLSNSLPLGEYIVTAVGSYNGSECRASFGVSIISELFTSKPKSLPAGTDGSAGTSGEYVYFGDWPQTLKEPSVTVDESNSMVSGAFTYYMGSDDCWYAKCKENAYASGYKYSDGTTTVAQDAANSYQYFKVEPIKWRVVSRDYESTGKALLVAEKILYTGVQYYDESESSASRTIDGDTVYPSNYKHSKIRAYLNGIDYNKGGSDCSDYKDKGFLQSAFSASAQSLIKTTTVRNDASSTRTYDGTTSTGSIFCDDTSDKVFLLSMEELVNNDWFEAVQKSEKRIRGHSDFALANGLYLSSGVGGRWWSRSPKFISPNHIAYTVKEDGNVLGATTYVNDTKSGIVPAICIDAP